jgi:serine/threonine-protein kinase
MEHPTRVGKYEIEKFLGGGMSHVYRAKDSVLGRRVAVKILTEAGMADAEAKARFLLEARMASSINHENIISVYDFGEDAGRPFMVMEFLEGESLRDAIKNNHTGDFRNRMRIALQAGRALDHIHSRKIIHRDIKPENINLDTQGKVKLMDFGIAKSEGVQLTRAGFTLGTPYYMAPEQVLGRPLTAQADVYAFGILLFELLSGSKPIVGTSIEQIFQQILYEPLNVAPLKALNIPPAAVDLVAYCTEKQVAQRAQTLGYVCEEIAHILDPGRPKPPKPLAPLPQTPSPTGTGQVSAQSAPAQTGAQRPTTQRPTTQRPPTTQPAVSTQAASVPTEAKVPAAAIQGLPGFLGKLPAPLQTQGGLMAMAAIAVLGLMFVFILILWAFRLI